ncbi:MAG: glutamate 5-kinase [Oscillospiraceae bacterium]|nr:glutamate 5-kinase [Oscillospiraceae bacterium]
MITVVKVGTSTVTHASGDPNMRLLVKLARVLSDLAARGHYIVLVTSGAIAVGIAKMNLSERPADLPGKQAAAAVGQCALMHTYDSVFSDYGRTVAQILLSRRDLEHEPSRQNLLNTFNTLFALQSVVIVNENDSVSAEEIEDCGMIFGDNDRLSAEVAALLNADLLVLLSDIDAVYDGDPRENANAKPLAKIHAVDDVLRACAQGPGSARGTGGMMTKLQAAEICLTHGIEMVIAHGGEPDVLYDIIDGKNVGTRFLAL